MSNKSEYFYVNYPSVVMDEVCSMKYWLSNFEGGTGVSPIEDVVPNRILEESLVDMRAAGQIKYRSKFRLKELVAEVLSGLTEGDKKNLRRMEQLYRRLGWFVAKVLFTEGEIAGMADETPLPDSVYVYGDNYMVEIPSGRLLKDRLTKKVTYQMFVPTYSGNVNDRWLRQQEYSVALQLGMQGAAEAAKCKVDFGQIVSMNMGFVMRNDGQLIHPYVYGKKNTLSGHWTNNTLTIGQQQNPHTWVQTPVWEYPAGLVEWVDFLGPEVGRAQFVHSGKTPFRRDLLDGWIKYRIHREREIEKAQVKCHERQEMRVVHFPRKTSACVDQITGKSCGFLDHCLYTRDVKKMVEEGRLIRNGRIVLQAATEEPKSEGEVTNDDRTSADQSVAASAEAAV